MFFLNIPLTVPSKEMGRISTKLSQLGNSFNDDRYVSKEGTNLTQNKSRIFKVCSEVLHK